MLNNSAVSLLFCAFCATNFQSRCTFFGGKFSFWKLFKYLNILDLVSFEVLLMYQFFCFVLENGQSSLLNGLIY